MDSSQDESETFSLSEGGPFNNALKKFRLQNQQAKLALVSVCVTWLPIFILTAIDGTLFSGPQLPFIKDVAMQARLLVALPMLILIKTAIDNQVISVSDYLIQTIVVSEDRNFIRNTTIAGARKLVNSVWTEIILLLIVIATTISLVKSGVFSGLEAGSDSWMGTTEDGENFLSLGGKWSVFVSIPIFQFLLCRWLWRYFVWILLLFQISKSKLQLFPSHPDRACGLGIVILAQRSFNLIFTAIAITISGELIGQIIINPASFSSIRTEVIVYIVACIFLLLFPLLFFSGRLAKAKHQGMLDHSKKATELSKQFEEEWVRGSNSEKMNNGKEIDPSTVFDYSGIYESVGKLRIIPVTARDIVGMAIVLFIPFIPILFIHFSVGELLKRVVGLLL